MKSFDELLVGMDRYPPRKIAVAVAEESSVVGAIGEAVRRGIAEAVLVGDEGEIHRISRDTGVPLDGVTVINEPEPVHAVSRAVSLVAGGEADILMKGFIHTDDFLRGILCKDCGLRTGSIMSHVFIAEVKSLDKLLFVTDCAMNILPDLEQKAAILLNAVHLANIFGVVNPRVAVLAAVELVNPTMPATVEAACLAKMADRNQYVPHCIVDGPLAMDNAVSLLAAKTKRITGPVAGQADILLVPNIESGNILVKAVSYLGYHRVIGLLVGAKAPVVLTSRADSTESKMLSIAAAVRMVNITREFRLKIGKVHY
jgi:phosphate butyryltransferase